MKPNILLLLPDQHRGDWLPFSKEIFEQLGVPDIPLKMPNLKSIMAKGVTFTNAITPSPLCAPARACLAAGSRYNHCDVPNNQYDYPTDKPTFYSKLKENSYTVGGVGKFDLHKNTLEWGLSGWLDSLGEMGFTTAIDNAGKIDAAISGVNTPKDPYMKLLHEQGYAKYYSEDILTRKLSIRPTKLPAHLYCDNYIGNNATHMIKNFSSEKPWFLQVNFTGPHDPWDITEKMREAWKDVKFPRPNMYNDDLDCDMNGIMQNYAAMLENIDRIIGDILSEIESRNELDHTVIIYSSDHGEMMGDFGLFGKSKYQRGSIHIPMIISTPGMKKPIINNSLVELQDLFPTILELCGISYSLDHDRHSLCPTLNGNRTIDRAYQISELGNFKVIKTASYKITLLDHKIIEVFNLHTDILENNNLVKTDPDLSDQIIAEVLMLM